MSLQYNDIATQYAAYYTPELLSCSALEQVQVHDALFAVGLKGKRVLELACGTGVYSRRLLEWGAASVVGLDISAAMLSEATAEAARQSIPPTRLTYVRGDAADPDLDVGGGRFDVVVAAWLLNYAPDHDTMTRMWRNIARHLVPGGKFVGLTTPPVTGTREDVDVASRNAWAKYGQAGYVTREVETGFEYLGFQGYPDVYPERVLALKCFITRPEVYESTAERGGMAGIEWWPMVYPRALREAYPAGYWNESVLNPNCRVVVAWS